MESCAIEGLCFDMEIFVLLCVLAFLIVASIPKKRRYKKRTFRHDRPQHTPHRSSAGSQLNDHARLVLKSDYKKQKLLNFGESQVYWAVIRTINESCAKSAYVFAQINLGEILTSKGGYSAINCKRVDLCITDRQYYPVAVIEVNGQGHENHTDGYRDMVKKGALEKAGVAYIAIETPIDNDSLSELIRVKLIPLIKTKAKESSCGV